MQFEWDEEKNKENKKKHGLGFEEAVKVFLDDKRIEHFDWKHSTDTEERWNIIGRMEELIIVFVVATERGKNIRIISARLAEEDEEYEYYQDYDAR